MRGRQLDTAVPAGPQSARPRRAGTPAAEPGRLPQGPLSGRAALGAGRPDPAAQAAELRQATGGQLARGGRLLVQLQRQRGNRYVQELVSHARQAEPAPAARGRPLVVGPAGDEHEREADRVAEQVMRLPARPGRMGEQAAAGVRSGRPPGPPAFQAPGRALPPAVRAGFEAALGADFGRVRIHAGDEAARLSRTLGAEAFTLGPDVYFGAGRYAPGTAPGRRLLAHELTHVVQQGRSEPWPRHAPEGGTVIPAVPASRPPAASGPAASGPAGLIQRKLDWRDTNWARATAAWASAAGAGGVVFVVDRADGEPEVRRGEEPVVIKTAARGPARGMSAENVVAANLHTHLRPGVGDWTVDVPGVRAVDRREGERIRRFVGLLVRERNDGNRGWNIIKRAPEPGTMVFEYAGGGEEFSALLRRPKHSEKSGLRGRKPRAESPIALFQNPEFVQTLGRIAAIDIFTGNDDRLTRMWNPENFKVDRPRQVVQLLDNVSGSMGADFKSSAIMTMQESLAAWKGSQWTTRLRDNQFSALADTMLERIMDGITEGMRGEDIAAVREAVGAAKEWLQLGLKSGKLELADIREKELVEALTAGIPEAERPEVHASIMGRLDYLFPPQ